MQEMTKVQEKAKELFYQPEYVADRQTELRQEAEAFGEGYKVFLNEGKTEREITAECERMLREAGYKPFDDRRRYEPGDKIYWINRNKAVVCSTIGTRSLEDGFHLVIAHADSPRLDLKPNPLYEKAHFSLLQTHYYGGLRKYQWTALPLSIHGVFFRADGTSVTVRIGEDPGDPVFCITDLLPHLSGEQNKRKLEDGVRGEELNVLIGSYAVEDPDVRQGVKLNTLLLLNEKYGITEKDFVRAEIELVPAQKARDIGFDRSLIGGYGQDDRVNSYAAIMAEIAAQNPAYTTVCVLTDKEEIGSEGVTGMHSLYTFRYMEQLCRCQGADPIRAFHNSKCLSADVSAAYDPTWEGPFEAQNGTYAGRGVALLKYTGSRGKSSSNDASAELVSYVTGLLDKAGVAWQLGELSKVDAGGGGTVAKFVAQHDIETLDIGVPVLSMHSPYEISSKVDLYMAYRAFQAFYGAEE